MATDSTEHSKEIARGGLWGFFGNAAFYLISFFYSVFITLAFPKNAVGLFYLGASIISLVGLVADFGISASIMRFIPYFEGREEKRKIKSVVFAGYIFAALLGLALSAILYLSSDSLAKLYSNPELSLALKILSPVLFLNNLVTISSAFMQSRSDMKSVALLQNVQNGSKILITFIIFSYSGASLPVLAFAFVLSVVCALAISSLLIWPHLKSLPEKTHPIIDVSLYSEMIPFAATAGIVGSINLAFSSTTQPILAYFTAPALLAGTVAVYSLATQLGSVLNVLPASILAIFSPVMSRLYGKKDMAGIRIISDSAQRWLMMLFLPLAVMVIVFSDDALQFLFGPAYVSGAPALSVFVLAILLSSLTQVFMVPLNVMMKLRLQIKIALLGGAVLLLLNLLLMPQLGILGAVISIFCSSLLVLLVARHYSSKLAGVDFSPTLIRLFIAALISFSLLLAAKPFISPAAHGLLGHSIEISIASFATRVASIMYFGALAIVSISIFLASAAMLRCFKREDIEVMEMVGEKLRIPKGLLRIIESLLLPSSNRDV